MVYLALRGERHASNEHLPRSGAAPALKHLAAEDGARVAEHVRRAVDRYIAAELSDESGWRERLEDFLARVGAKLPEGVSPEEVESDITAAREEARKARRGGSSLTPTSGSRR